MISTELAPGEFLFLDRDAVESLLDPVAVVQRCEDAFRWVGAGDVVQRNPVNLYLDDSPTSDAGSGTIQAFPAYVKPLGVVGLKWLAWFRRNPGSACHIGACSTTHPPACRWPSSMQRV